MFLFLGPQVSLSSFCCTRRTPKSVGKIGNTRNTTWWSCMVLIFVYVLTLCLSAFRFKHLGGKASLWPKWKVVCLHMFFLVRMHVSQGSCHRRQCRPSRPKCSTITTNSACQPARKEPKSGKQASPGPGDMCAFLGPTFFIMSTYQFQKYAIFWFSCLVHKLQHVMWAQLRLGFAGYCDIGTFLNFLAWSWCSVISLLAQTPICKHVSPTNRKAPATTYVFICWLTSIPRFMMLYPKDSQISWWS